MEATLIFLNNMHGVGGGDDSPVNAFMKVESERVSILKNGSLTGYFCEPHSVVCSKMCATPVLSMGVVRNPTLEGGQTHAPTVNMCIVIDVCVCVCVCGMYSMYVMCVYMYVCVVCTVACMCVRYVQWVCTVCICVWYVQWRVCVCGMYSGYVLCVYVCGMYSMYVYVCVCTCMCVWYVQCVCVVCTVCTCVYV